MGSINPINEINSYIEYSTTWTWRKCMSSYNDEAESSYFCFTNAKLKFPLWICCHIFELHIMEISGKFMNTKSNLVANEVGRLENEKDSSLWRMLGLRKWSGRLLNMYVIFTNREKHQKVSLKNKGALAFFFFSLLCMKHFLAQSNANM